MPKMPPQEVTFRPTFTSYIFTVKLARNPQHDPRNKQTGECPVSDYCTDVTGEHHSFIVQVADQAGLEARIRMLKDQEIHLTRIEQVSARTEGTL